MDSKTNRYKNARALVEEAGSVTLFGKKIGMKRTQASQIAGDRDEPKDIGDNIARRIEAAFNKKVGWLDIPHGQNFLDDLDLDDQASSVLEIYKRLSPEARLKLFRHAQGIELLDE